MSDSDKKVKLSYGKVITLNFILLSIIPLLIFGIITISLITRNMENDVAQKNMILAGSIASEVNIFLNYQKNVLADISDSIEEHYHHETDLIEYMSSILEHHVFYESIQYINKEGAIALTFPYNQEIIGYSMINHPSVTEALKTGSFYYSAPFLSLSTGELSITVSHPGSNGVIVVYINMSLLQDIINRVNEGTTRFAFMTDLNGVIIAHPDKSYVSQRSNVNHLNIVKGALAGTEETYRYDFQEKEHIGSVAIVSETGWPVIITQTIREAFFIIRRLRSFLWSGVFAALIASIIVSILSSRRIVKPITMLTASTRKISGGDYDLTSLMHSSYIEIEALSKDFLKMIKAVKEREEALLGNEIELKAARNYLSEVFNSLNSILIVVDQDGKINQWNTAAESFSGFAGDEVKKKKVWDIIPILRKYQTLFNEVFILKESKEIHNIKIDGYDESFFSISFYPLFSRNFRDVVIRIDDVTERVRIQELMIQSEKMLSVGGLAAGMAHEINNPLAGIMQNLQVLNNRLTKDLPANLQAAGEADIDLNKLKTYLKNRKIFSIMQAAQDSGVLVAKIVKDMLSFSRKSEMNFTLCEIGTLLDKTLEMLDSSSFNLATKYDFKMINIVRDYEDDLPAVMCDKSKIQQVFLNILQNGAQAMMESKPIDLTSKKQEFILRLKLENNMVCIEIEDNGPGMSDEVKKRIFEPFYTTKSAGKGTGLGLSISYFIITENHGGKMAVESTFGNGTTFIIHLPLKEKSNHS